MGLVIFENTCHKFAKTLSLSSYWPWIDLFQMFQTLALPKLGLICQRWCWKMVNSIQLWYFTALRLVHIFEMIIFWLRIINKLAYWTCLDVFQHQKPKFFPNFLQYLGAFSSFALKLYISEIAFLKTKVELGNNLHFLFRHQSYWTCLDLFQSILAKFVPKISISSSSLFLWHVKIAHFLLNSCLP